MRFHDFVREVQARGMESTEEALRDTKVLLGFFGEELSREKRRKLAAQLPKELRAFIEQGAERIPPAGSKCIPPLEEFYDRVVQRSGDRQRVLARVRAVTSVLRDTCGGSFEEVMSALPAEYAEIAPAGGAGRALFP